MTEVKVHFNGWIELPEEACAALSLRTGAMLDIALVDGRIVLTPAKARKAGPSAAPTMEAVPAQKPDPVPAPAATAIEPEAPRRRGRPPGAKNVELPRIGPAGLKVRGRSARMRTLETVD